MSSSSVDVTLIGGPSKKFYDQYELNSAAKITAVCDRIKEMLLDKNAKYGDSALKPIRVFSKADTAEQIRVRLDDKLSRVRTAHTSEDEDVVLDLIGYLVLYLIAIESTVK